MKRSTICSAAALVCALTATSIAAADPPNETDTRNRPNLCCYPHRFFALPLKPINTTPPIRGEDKPASIVHPITRRIAQGPPAPVIVLPWIFDVHSVGVSTLGRF
jgi:hypothetical protein